MIQPFFEQTVEAGLTFGLSSCGYDIRIAERLRLMPGCFELASSLEYFDLPHDLRMSIHDKSTWARRGVAVQNTIAEPGWRGYLTLELSNHSTEWYVIAPGTPIAQVCFNQLSAATEQPYKGRYQDQPAGPQPAIEAKDSR
jgi:dCTP deaminase